MERKEWKEQEEASPRRTLRTLVYRFFLAYSFLLINETSYCSGGDNKSYKSEKNNKSPDKKRR